MKLTKKMNISEYVNMKNIDTALNSLTFDELKERYIYRMGRVEYVSGFLVLFSIFMFIFGLYIGMGYAVG